MIGVNDNELERLRFNGVEYAIVPVNPNDKSINDYTKPDASIGYVFRLPAIKCGENLNDDECNQMYQLICHNENNRVIVERVEKLVYDEGDVFFTKNRKVIYAVRIAHMPNEIIVGRTGINYGIVEGVWKYEVSSRDECPWLGV